MFHFHVSSALSSPICFLTTVLLVTALSIPIATATASSFSSSRCYKTIFSFGDSLADTGTYYYDSLQTTQPCLNPPYGRTYFHHPTDRWSDGRLIIDFIVQHLGLPFLKPYMGIKNGKIKDWNAQEGINFAVAGATALDVSFFADKGCKEVLGSSLFLVGEIGGNDFNYPVFQYKGVRHTYL